MHIKGQCDIALEVLLFIRTMHYFLIICIICYFEWWFILPTQPGCVCVCRCGCVSVPVVFPGMSVPNVAVLLGFRESPLTKYFQSAGALWLEFDTDASSTNNQ